LSALFTLGARRLSTVLRSSLLATGGHLRSARIGYGRPGRKRSSRTTVYGAAREPARYSVARTP